MPLRILRSYFLIGVISIFFPAFDQNSIFHKSNSKIPRYYLGNLLIQPQLFSIEL